MTGIAYLFTSNGRFNCYVKSEDGDSELSIPEKEAFSIPDLLKGLREYGREIRFDRPPISQS